MMESVPIRFSAPGWALALAVLASCAAQRACAQDADLAQLRQQVAELRKAIDQLDASLQRLEHAGSGAPAPQVPVQAARPEEGGDAQVKPAPAPAADARSGLNAHEIAVLQEQARTADALTAWRELRAGMNQEQVRQLLGSPRSVITVSNRTGWLYSYAKVGPASVFFDHDGIVISTMPPSQGALRLY